MAAVTSTFLLGHCFLPPPLQRSSGAVVRSKALAYPGAAWPDTLGLRARRAEGAVPLWVQRRAEAKGGVGLPLGIRVGVLVLPDSDAGVWDIFAKLNVTEDAYFQTEVPSTFQLPLAAKLLAMSNTIDVVMVAHSALGEGERSELYRSLQSVALATNMPVVPADPEGVLAAASTALQMGEMRQQAVFRGGPRKNTFFGIGQNQTAPTTQEERVYF